MKSQKTSKEDLAILKITKSIGYMSYLTLYDQFNFQERRIRRYYAEMIALKEAWRDDQVPTAEMIQKCENWGIHTVAWLKRIPTSTKLRLVGKNAVPGIMNYIESAFLVNVIMSIIVLKEKFRFTKAQLNDYLNKIGYYVDSYTRKQPGTNKYYLNDNMIIQIFRDELKIDLVTGEKVA
jgi:hypothetical protein